MCGHHMTTFHFAPPPNDCIKLVNRIPSLQLRPDVQSDYTNITLAIPILAGVWKPPTVPTLGHCMISVVVSDIKTGRYLTPSPETWKLVVCTRAKVNIDDVWRECVLNGTRGSKSYWWRMPEDDSPREFWPNIRLRVAIHYTYELDRPESRWNTYSGDRWLPEEGFCERTEDGDNERSVDRADDVRFLY